jgi:hypothetical protein
VELRDHWHSADYVPASDAVKPNWRGEGGVRSANPRSPREVVRAPALRGAHPGDDVSGARRGCAWARTRPAEGSVGASN